MLTTSRRLFIGSTLGLSAAMAFPSVSILGSAKPLRILILGGTGFIGPYVVQHALDRGHQITLFNRGRSNPGLFPDVERLIGDRENDLETLKGREWDVVLDNSGRIPEHVKLSTDLLKDSVDRYFFMSSRSVYKDMFTAPSKREDAPVVEITAASQFVGKAETIQVYAERKVLGERQVRTVFGNRSTIVRPTLVAGPHDHTDRFTYWAARVHRGGDILAPGDGLDPIQYIDVRDLAEFMVHILEEDLSGTFNVAGPASHLSTAEFLYGIRSITSSKLRFVWVDADFLRKQDIIAQKDMPMWSPAVAKSGKPESPLNSDKSIAHGLKYRPLAVTAKDTLDWYLAKEDSGPMGVGLSSQQEMRLLAAWQRQQ